MASINFNKLIEKFKNMKSDAVPRAPRPSERPEDQNRANRTTEPNQENLEDQEEEIVIEPEDLRKDDKKKRKPKPNVKVEDVEDVNIDGEEKRSSSAHIQATGTVYNIMNSKHVRLGNDFYFGPVTQSSSANASESTTKDKKPQAQQIKKDNLISLIMEAKIKPDHDYMDYISKNLGKDWHSFFRALKFSQGRIETAEINAAGYDISEARYKLLLDWVNNDKDGSLGRLTTLLWEEGERSIVKELSLMYKKSKK